jgi:hypothetical protein
MFFFFFKEFTFREMGARGSAVFEALRYMSEGRGFYSQWCHGIFSLI